LDLYRRAYVRGSWFVGCSATVKRRAVDEGFLLLKLTLNNSAAARGLFGYG